MKKYLFLLIALAFVLLQGCSNNFPTQNENNRVGNVTLKFDKINAPKDVIAVTAYLTRENYDTLSANMNVNSAQSADLLMDNVPVGTWQLTVNATNSSDVIVYTGQSDIQVLDGATTQVNLTLQPTGEGRGSVYIAVSWGTNASAWIDYYQNPLMTRDDNTDNPNGVCQTTVLIDNNKYKTWYAHMYNSSVTDIWYAESADGYTWQNVVNHAVLAAGDSGSWDDYKVLPGAVIKDNGYFKLFYIGTQNPYDNWQIGVAVSSDGINWEKSPNPILTSNSEEYQIAVHSIVKRDSIYYLYYDSRTSNTGKFDTRLAVSYDGSTWNRSNQNPVMTATENWENGGVAFPSVVWTGSSYFMVYEGNDHSGFGSATSTDGITWVKNSANPFLTASTTYNSWAEQIAYPCLIKAGDHYRVYYTTSDQQANMKIGVVIK